MTINRFNARRDANEPEIITEFERLGAQVIRIDEPCDLIVGYKGHCYLVEVKTEKGKLTATQEKFTKEWRHGFHIVRSTKDVQEFIEKINRLDEPKS